MFSLQKLDKEKINSRNYFDTFNFPIRCNMKNYSSQIFHIDFSTICFLIFNRLRQNVKKVTNGRRPHLPLIGTEKHRNRIINNFHHRLIFLSSSASFYRLGENGQIQKVGLTITSPGNISRNVKKKKKQNILRNSEYI